MTSPKHKFFGTVDLVIRKLRNTTTTFPISDSADTIEALRKRLAAHAANTAHIKGEHRYRISENKAQYPSFDWVVIEKSTINA